MEQEKPYQDTSAINEFLKRYKELVNTLTYDNEFGEMSKVEDEIDELSAYKIKKRNIERSKRDKRGTSEIFSMRLSEELDSLGIENHLIKILGNNSVDWANLYNNNGEWMLIDMALDVEQRTVYNRIVKHFSIEPLEAFLLYYPNSYIVEDIQDNGKRLEELEIKSLHFLGKEEQPKKEVILIETNIFKRLLNWLKDGVKSIITELGMDVLFEPYKPPEFNDEEITKKEQKDDKEKFVQKVQVDEEIAIKVAKEKNTNEQSQEKIKEE